MGQQSRRPYWQHIPLRAVAWLLVVASTFAYAGVLTVQTPVGYHSASRSQQIKPLHALPADETSMLGVQDAQNQTPPVVPPPDNTDWTYSGTAELESHHGVQLTSASQGYASAAAYYDSRCLHIPSPFHLMRRSLGMKQTAWRLPW